MRKFDNILITGGAGFIGTNFIRFLFEQAAFQGRIINLDKLTYAGNPYSLQDIYEQYNDSRYFFVQADICDGETVENVIDKYNIDTIVHFAAESHVDRSIHGPAEFIRTNVNGTFALLEAARSKWGDRKDVLYHHISTDEVYGSLGDTGYFTETTSYDPRSPYSASKASSDHLVQAYNHTYGLPITLTNCSNNYGPYQFPEKLIPVMIENMLEGKPLPVYGDGKNVRDWLYVEDHNRAVWDVMCKSETGETYNIGGENEWENIHLVESLCSIVAKEAGRDEHSLLNLITFVKDRPGHDRRYAIDCSKIKKRLGWSQTVSFEEGLQKTVRWYLANRQWIETVKRGEYQNWMDMNYTKR